MRKKWGDWCVGRRDLEGLYTKCMMPTHNPHQPASLPFLKRTVLSFATWINWTNFEAFDNAKFSTPLHTSNICPVESKTHQQRKMIRAARRDLMSPTIVWLYQWPELLFSFVGCTHRKKMKGGIGTASKTYPPNTTWKLSEFCALPQFAHSTSSTQHTKKRDIFVQILSLNSRFATTHSK